MARRGVGQVGGYAPVLRTAAVVLASVVGAVTVSATPASACTITAPKPAAEQLQADLAEQSGAWEGSTLIYLGVVVEVGLAADAQTSPSAPRPGAQQRTVRVMADRVLKGRLPDAALMFEFQVNVFCVPSDMAKSFPGDRLIIYAGASGPDDRSGAIRLDRIRDPATLAALREIDDVLSADLNRDGTIDTAILTRPHGASFAGLEIHLREPHGALRRVLAVPDFAWGARGGGSAGSRPSLGLSEDGALRVHEQATGSGADRFEQTRTLEWGDDRFILSRFERTDWTVDHGMTDRCTVDLTRGVAVWNGDTSRFPATTPGVEHTTRWSSCGEAVEAVSDIRIPVAPPLGPPVNE